MTSFRHLNSHKSNSFKIEGTVAIETPSKQYLEVAFNAHATQLCLLIGLARLHPKDNFCKKIGREKSQYAMSPEYVRLISVEIRGVRHIYHCLVNSKVYKFKFGLSTIAESDIVNLAYVADSEPGENVV